MNDVSSEVEHQINTLAVTGSTPVPQHRLKTDSANRSRDLLVTQPKGGDRWVDWSSPWFAPSMAASENPMQDVDSAVALARQRCVNGLVEGS